MKLIRIETKHDNVRDQHLTAYTVTEEDFNEIVKPERFNNLKVTDKLKVTVCQDGTYEYYDRWPTGTLRLIGVKRADGTYEYHYS